jgi:hypothetical protein
VQLFGDFANQIIDATIKSDAGASSIDIGSFAYDLAVSDDECATNRRALTEGTTGIIFDNANSSVSGTINTSDASNYCFKIDHLNNVGFASKPTDSTNCLNTEETKGLVYYTLNNPQIIFFLQFDRKAFGRVRTEEYS